MSKFKDRIKDIKLGWLLFLFPLISTLLAFAVGIYSLSLSLWLFMIAYVFLGIGLIQLGFTIAVYMLIIRGYKGALFVVFNVVVLLLDIVLIPIFDILNIVF